MAKVRIIVKSVRIIAESAGATTQAEALVPYGPRTSGRMKGDIFIERKIYRKIDEI